MQLFSIIFYDNRVENYFGILECGKNCVDCVVVMMGFDEKNYRKYFYRFLKNCFLKIHTALCQIFSKIYGQIKMDKNLN